MARPNRPAPKGGSRHDPPHRRTAPDAADQCDHSRKARAARMAGTDPCPVVKFFNPLGAATWLATELGRDGDTLFGLADLGFGCPELGYFSLSEIRAEIGRAHV